MQGDKKKWYICKDGNREVYATDYMAQGESLASVDDLKDNSWLFERFPNSIFIVGT
ncbi:hypothetical protein [Brevibacillus sp. 179-C9.3 HS]|uniref:hypothetical protein n=1 Tax=unclassified Brevibacillus TaxID=2684853 RepID=UPI0039A0942F